MKGLRYALFCIPFFSISFALAATGSEVHWESVKGAEFYRVAISRDAAGLDVVFDESVKAKPNEHQQTLVVKDLQAGGYFAQIQGLMSDGAPVGHKLSIAVVLGSEFTISGNRYGLAPPHPLSPTAGSVYDPHAKILFHWTKVKSTDRYRLRVVSEDDPSNNLMVVETKENTLEADDMPPSSYRYPKKGLYRWYISCVTGPADVKPTVGDEAVGSFEIGNSNVLKNSHSFELHIKPQLGRFNLSTYSGMNRSEAKDHGTAHGFAAELNSWIKGGWGVQAKASYITLSEVSLAKTSLPLRGLELRVVGASEYDYIALTAKRSSYWERRVFLGLGIRELPLLDGADYAKNPSFRGVSAGAAFIRHGGTNSTVGVGADFFIPFQIEFDQPAELKRVNFMNVDAYAFYEYRIIRELAVNVGPHFRYARNRFQQTVAETDMSYSRLALEFGVVGRF